jgi:hypothetical protein
MLNFQYNSNRWSTKSGINVKIGNNIFVGTYLNIYFVIQATSRTEFVRHPLFLICYSGLFHMYVPQFVLK